MHAQESKSEMTYPRTPSEVSTADVVAAWRATALAGLSPFHQKLFEMCSEPTLIGTLSDIQAAQLYIQLAEMIEASAQKIPMNTSDFVKKDPAPLSERSPSPLTIREPAPLTKKENS